MTNPWVRWRIGRLSPDRTGLNRTKITTKGARPQKDVCNDEHDRPSGPRVE